MLFNSYIFVLLFLPASIFGYFCLNHFEHYKLAKIFLVGMSLWFYGYFNIFYLPIIVVSIIGNYFISIAIDNLVNNRFRKILLYVVVILNLGSIFYFKYYDFFIQNVNEIFNKDYVLLNLVLPLGISFFTFQQIGYQLDHYRDHIQYNFWDYALFVTFFPQLIAGPIVTHNEIIPQFEDMKNRRMSFDNIERGISIFILGLSKKVLIADVVGGVANYGFSNIDSLNTISAIFVILAYTFQIYFDFSGYSDMAIGIGYMFNVILPQNFNSPYKAYSVKEFWKRWHMTLTRFLRESIYIPLGGNRKGNVRTYLNTMIVYFFSGLWHGANWTFILWGMIHGGACVLESCFRSKIEKMHLALRWILTFVFINITWVYFRADTIKDANKLLSKLVYIDIGSIPQDIISVFELPELAWITQLGIPSIFLFVSIYCILLWIVLGTQNLYEKAQTLKLSIFKGIVLGGILILNILSFSRVSTFLYFNF